MWNELAADAAAFQTLTFFSAKFWTRFFPHLFKPKTHPRVPFEADNNDQYREERRPRRCLNSLPSEEEGKAKKESFLASGLLCQNYQKGPSLAKKQKKKKTTTYSQFRRIIYCSCVFISCNSRRKSRNWVKIKTNFASCPLKNGRRRSLLKIRHHQYHHHLTPTHEPSLIGVASRHPWAASKIILPISRLFAH